ncbi:MAG: hypothetical protein U0836_09040 [Pirellulales bacterium]
MSEGAAPWRRDPTSLRDVLLATACFALSLRSGMLAKHSLDEPLVALAAYSAMMGFLVGGAWVLILGYRTVLRLLTWPWRAACRLGQLGRKS